MKIKKTLYPKTKRIGKEENKVVITEKLDGSNLGLLKLDDDTLIVAQRNYIFIIKNDEDIEEHKKDLYKHLYDWLKKHYKKLLDSLHTGSGIFGEWLAMGHIKYPEDQFPNRFNMFAKVNVYEENGEIKIRNLNYDIDLFIYPFINKEIPNYISVVPVVEEFDITNYPTISDLNTLYKAYLTSVGRTVEGFIISYKNNIEKYVRFKGGKLTEHIIQ